jgi:hypothetical protein
VGNELAEHADAIDDREPGNEHNEHETPQPRRHCQRRASHPAVTSFEASIATAMVTTDCGVPGKSTTMPLIENHAAAPARAIAAA